MSIKSNSLRHPFWFCFGLISIGIFLRFYGVDFDRGHHLHPDERFLTMIINEIEFPSSIVQYFDTQRSPLNPVNKGFEFYVYGDFPILIGKAVARILGVESYDKFLSVGRPLVALADVATLIVLFLMASRWLGYGAGLMAAALYSLSVLPIQLSHFFTVDPFLNLFATTALYRTMVFYEEPRVKNAMLVGLFGGLAISCKISGFFLVPACLIALILMFIKGVGRVRLLLLGFLMLLCILGTFRLLNPYAFASSNPLDFRLSKLFLNNLYKLNQISQPFSGFPPSLQWAFRPSFFYPLKNLALWGTGLCLFVSATAGFILSLSRLWLKRIYVFAIPVSACLILVGMVGLYPVQTMRYLLPLYPLICFLGALFLDDFAGRLKRIKFRCLPFVFVVSFTLFWALAFSSIFSKPMTRIEASYWMARNIPKGSTICTESWDDSLPLGGIGRDRFRFVELNLTDIPSKQKVDRIVSALEGADYYVISSNRSYGPLSRLGFLFPISARFYEMLFGNVSGYRLKKEFLSYPSLGPVIIPDDDAEEAFTVYDHPRVFIFEKTGSFSPDKIRRELLFALEKKKAEQTMQGPSTSMVPITGKYVEQLEGEEVLFFLRFLALLIAGGLTGSLLAKHLLFIRGFPSRTLVFLIGAIFYCFVLRFVGPLKTIFPQVFFWFVVAISVACLWRRGELVKTINLNSLVFWTVFTFFLFCRAHNPAIFWGERPLDFSLLNAMTRSSSYPPVDPWFAGDVLRYHGWGQFFMAFLGRCVCVPPAYLYNLATALVPALCAECLFWMVRYTSGKIWPAILAVILALLGGNLSCFYFFPWKGGLNFDDFWNASRIIPGTINEFPLWTSLFGDLHGHFIGMVFSMLFLASLFVFLKEKGSHMLIKWATVAGLSLSALCLTNPWALPVYVFVMIVLLMTKDVSRAVLFLVAVSLVCLMIVYPFWYLPVRSVTLIVASEYVDWLEFLVIFGGFFVILMSCFVQSIPFKLYHFSIIIFLVGIILYYFPYAVTILLFLLLILLAYLWRLNLDDRRLLPTLLIICAIIIALGSDVFVLADRMNTIFKYYFEIWILLAIAIPIFLSSSDFSVGYYKAFTDSLTFIVMLCVFTTSFFIFVAWWQNPKIESDSFTLNGLHYLLEKDPSEAEMVAYLQPLNDQPVIVEAFGPSYGPFARISSFTGLPTVVGWEYHVFQHGHPMKEIKIREADVKDFYESNSFSKIQAIVKKYKIHYVILGKLERKVYGPLAGRCFKEAGLRLLARFGQEEIWSSEGIL